VLVLINACYSGAFLRRSFGPTTYVPKYGGAHAITAGGAKERSWHDPQLGEGSVFFEKLFAALGGQADTSPVNADGTRGDGVITVDELATYLKQEIRISSDQRQNPMAGDISTNGSLGGFFFLNRRKMIANGVVPEWSPKRVTPFGITPDAEASHRATENSRPIVDSRKKSVQSKQWIVVTYFEDSKEAVAKVTGEHLQLNGYDVTIQKDSLKDFPDYKPVSPLDLQYFFESQRVEAEKIARLLQQYGSVVTARLRPLQSGFESDIYQPHYALLIF
jgi:hypothetical protein